MAATKQRGKRTATRRPKRPARVKKKKAARKPRARASPQRQPHRHHPELVGVGLVAVGLFLASVLWFGWNGGLVGGAVADGFLAAGGWAAYALPAAAVAIRALMGARSELGRFRPFRAGEILTAVGLVVTLRAAHGGWVGETISRGLAALIGGTGTAIAGATTLLVGALLLSGASLG